MSKLDNNIKKNYNYNYNYNCNRHWMKGTQNKRYIIIKARFGPEF